MNLEKAFRETFVLRRTRSLPAMKRVVHSPSSSFLCPSSGMRRTRPEDVVLASLWSRNSGRTCATEEHKKDERKTLQSSGSHSILEAPRRDVIEESHVDLLKNENRQKKTMKGCEDVSCLPLEIHGELPMTPLKTHEKGMECLADEVGDTSISSVLLCAKKEESSRTCGMERSTNAAWIPAPNEAVKEEDDLPSTRKTPVCDVNLNVEEKEGSVGTVKKSELPQEEITLRDTSNYEIKDEKETLKKSPLGECIKDQESLQKRKTEGPKEEEVEDVEEKNEKRHGEERPDTKEAITEVENEGAHTDLGKELQLPFHLASFQEKALSLFSSRIPPSSVSSSSVPFGSSASQDSKYSTVKEQKAVATPSQDGGNTADTTIEVHNKKRLWALAWRSSCASTPAGVQKFVSNEVPALLAAAASSTLYGSPFSSSSLGSPLTFPWARREKRLFHPHGVVGGGSGGLDHMSRNNMSKGFRSEASGKKILFSEYRAKEGRRVGEGDPTMGSNDEERPEPYKTYTTNTMPPTTAFPVHRSSTPVRRQKAEGEGRCGRQEGDEEEMGSPAAHRTPQPLLEAPHTEEHTGEERSAAPLSEGLMMEDVTPVVAEAKKDLERNPAGEYRANDRSKRGSTMFTPGVGANTSAFHHAMQKWGEDHASSSIPIAQARRQRGLFGAVREKQLHQMVVAVLNKVSDDEKKFREVRTELMNLPVPEAAPEELDRVLQAFLRKAIAEPCFSMLYARLMECLCLRAPTSGSTLHSSARQPSSSVLASTSSAASFSSPSLSPLCSPSLGPSSSGCVADSFSPGMTVTTAEESSRPSSVCSGEQNTSTTTAMMTSPLCVGPSPPSPPRTSTAATPMAVAQPTTSCDGGHHDHAVWSSSSVSLQSGLGPLHEPETAKEACDTMEDSRGAKGNTSELPTADASTPFTIPTPSLTERVGRGIVKLCLDTFRSLLASTDEGGSNVWPHEGHGSTSMTSSSPSVGEPSVCLTSTRKDEQAWKTAVSPLAGVLSPALRDTGGSPGGFSSTVVTAAAPVKIVGSGVDALTASLAPIEEEKKKRIRDQLCGTVRFAFALRTIDFISDEDIAHILWMCCTGRTPMEMEQVGSPLSSSPPSTTRRRPPWPALVPSPSYLPTEGQMGALVVALSPPLLKSPFFRSTMWKEGLLPFMEEWLSYWEHHYPVPRIRFLLISAREEVQRQWKQVCAERADIERGSPNAEPPTRLPLKPPASCIFPFSPPALPPSPPCWLTIHSSPYEESGRGKNATLTSHARMEGSGHDDLASPPLTTAAVSHSISEMPSSSTLPTRSTSSTMTHDPTIGALIPLTPFDLHHATAASFTAVTDAVSLVPSRYDLSLVMKNCQENIWELEMVVERAFYYWMHQEDPKERKRGGDKEGTLLASSPVCSEPTPEEMADVVCKVRSFVHDWVTRGLQVVREGWARESTGALLHLLLREAKRYHMEAVLTREVLKEEVQRSMRLQFEERTYEYLPRFFGFFATIVLSDTMQAVMNPNWLNEGLLWVMEMQLDNELSSSLSDKDTKEEGEEEEEDCLKEPTPKLKMERQRGAWSVLTPALVETIGTYLVEVGEVYHLLGSHWQCKRAYVKDDGCNLNYWNSDRGMSRSRMEKGVREAEGMEGRMLGDERVQEARQGCVICPTAVGNEAKHTEERSSRGIHHEEEKSADEENGPHGAPIPTSVLPMTLFPSPPLPARFRPLPTLLVGLAETVPLLCPSTRTNAAPTDAVESSGWSDDPSSRPPCNEEEEGSKRHPLCDSPIKATSEDTSAFFRKGQQGRRRMFWSMLGLAVPVVSPFSAVEEPLKPVSSPDFCIPSSASSSALSYPASFESFSSSVPPFSMWLKTLWMAFSSSVRQKLTEFFVECNVFDALLEMWEEERREDEGDTSVTNDDDHEHTGRSEKRGTASHGGGLVFLSPFHPMGHEGWSGLPPSSQGTMRTRELYDSICAELERRSQLFLRMEHTRKSHGGGGNESAGEELECSTSLASEVLCGFLLAGYTLHGWGGKHTPPHTSGGDGAAPFSRTTTLRPSNTPLYDHSVNPSTSRGSSFSGTSSYPFVSNGAIRPFLPLLRLLAPSLHVAVDQSPADRRGCERSLAVETRLVFSVLFLFGNAGEVLCFSSPPAASAVMPLGEGGPSPLPPPLPFLSPSSFLPSVTGLLWSTCCRDVLQELAAMEVISVETWNWWWETQMMEEEWENRDERGAWGSMERCMTDHPSGVGYGSGPAASSCVWRSLSSIHQEGLSPLGVPTPPAPLPHPPLGYGSGEGISLPSPYAAVPPSVIASSRVPPVVVNSRTPWRSTPQMWAPPSLPWPEEGGGGHPVEHQRDGSRSTTEPHTTPIGITWHHSFGQRQGPSATPHATSVDTTVVDEGNTWPSSSLSVSHASLPPALPSSFRNTSIPPKGQDIMGTTWRRPSTRTMLSGGPSPPPRCSVPRQGTWIMSPTNREWQAGRHPPETRSTALLRPTAEEGWKGNAMQGPHFVSPPTASNTSSSLPSSVPPTGMVHTLPPQQPHLPSPYPPSSRHTISSCSPESQGHFFLVSHPQKGHPMRTAQPSLWDMCAAAATAVPFVPSSGPPSIEGQPSLSSARMTPHKSWRGRGGRRDGNASGDRYYLPPTPRHREGTR